ncbi:o-succinylbenzoate synthase [Streptosporangium carneum]|uniref:o-succinylbenzoate synthase n=1 Tax=Streptosporangium carneum TaxID=47481 RepID=A0A9W6HZR1_9ACTN|nr:o-succinylbenzoate synthase [Streptosporangium carneum]GLK09360.1 o-succinylbenzoate synthase [Streptosporangium carneum]
MRLKGAELRKVELPLVTPFRTSLGTQTVREALLVRVVTDEGEGWAECVAEDEPTYCPEYLEGAADVIRRFLLPALFPLELDPAAVAPAFRHLRAHPMAKSAVETAVLDAWLRARDMSLAAYLGAVRRSLSVGVSIGIKDTVDELLGTVDKSLADGYVRIKLKIEPGWDLEPVRRVRETFGADVMLTVDANTAYKPGDIPYLTKLDAYGLAMIEQPFAPGDLHAHARLAARMSTPICLDESITSAHDAVAAIRQEACSIINIKPGRVGGYLESRRIHDVAQAHGLPVWCGGMLETGLGRAANLALAALPGFTLPGDISATRRYYERDITAPFTLVDGEMSVPEGPGIGITPEPSLLEALTTATEWIPAP